MNNEKYISIGIPFYNAEKYLEDAICSILAQTHNYWELILIDDGSTDGSLEIAREFEKKDSRIRVISDGLNKKLPYRLNQIIDESQHGYIARMDADDLISSTRIETQFNYLYKNPTIDLVSTGILSLKNDLTLVGYRCTSSQKIITKADAIVGTTGIIHASIIAKKSWFNRNRYNENNSLAEDYELWLNAFLKNDLKVGFIEEPLYYYREEQNITIEKLLKAYNTQVNIIKSVSSKDISFFDRVKYLTKIKSKKLIVRALFLTNLDDFLYKRRVQVQSLDVFEPMLIREITLINSEKGK
ncbi:glycosyltransferase family 2 protein [Psychrobacter proteolyticus]|uniref:Glycosyltransferase family A protein n=1 Tax=Psychrobacter proteolyticus TaxID=147825 RepID=A0ABV0DAK7_9GAMM